MITTVLIDVDDTLLDFNKSARISATKSFADCGIVFTDEIYKTFLEVNGMLWKQVEDKIITRDQLHYVRWNIILEKMGLKGDGHAIEKGFLKYLFDCAVLIDGAKEACEYLSSKYTLCTASNAPHLQQINRLTISGLKPYIKHIFTSEASGVSKPDKKFFDECFKVLKDSNVDNTIMIGDSLSSDIFGGKNYGMKTVWVKNGKNEEYSNLPDYTINSIKEISSIL